MQRREIGAKRQPFPVVGKWLIVMGVILLAIANL